MNNKTLLVFGKVVGVINQKTKNIIFKRSLTIGVYTGICSSNALPAIPYISSNTTFD